MGSGGGRLRVRAGSSKPVPKMSRVNISLFIISQTGFSSLSSWKSCRSTNQLEKLEAARSAYLWLPFLTFGCLSLRCPLLEVLISRSARDC